MKRIFAIVAQICLNRDALSLHYFQFSATRTTNNFEVYKHCQRHNGRVSSIDADWQLELGEKISAVAQRTPIRHLHLYYAAAYKIN